MRTSDSLVIGESYSRARLGEMFGLAPIAFQRGVFKPKDHASVWVFVTEEAGDGVDPRGSVLRGDVLHWGGVSGGRSEALVLEHAARGLELVLFHRRNAAQYPDRGFRYEGAFAYDPAAADAEAPTRFVLRRIG